MKLRIKGNSIRFRLLQSEVGRLEAVGSISDETRFGIRTDQAFKYSVAVSDGVDELDVEFSDNQILVLLPETKALEWCTNDIVGIERSIEIDGETTLAVLIEKDFECVGRPDDPDRSDAYPHPEYERQV
jgi:hypothetical protein